MLAFNALSRAEQLRHLRPLARAALAAYDLGPSVRFVPIQHWLNTTYRVDTGSGRYTLRIHRTGLSDPAAIRSELQWLAALHLDTDMVVPDPLLARDGAPLVTVQAPGVPEGRHCVLFRWVEGQFLRARLNERALAQAGAFLARLHQHSARFIPPAGFTRPRWDAATLLGDSLGIPLAKSLAGLLPDQRPVIDAATEYSAATMATLDEDPAYFGLLHGDFHEGNYLFYRGQVRAIDFDNCGWGYYLFDLAVACTTLLLHYPQQYPALRAAFLQGYVYTRPLDLTPARREALLDMFVVARLRMHTLWQTGLLDNPVFRDKGPARIARQIAILSELLP